MNVGFIYQDYEEKLSGVNRYSKSILEEFNDPSINKFCLGSNFLGLNDINELRCLYQNNWENDMAKKEQYLLAKEADIDILISFFKPILLENCSDIKTVLTIHDLAPLVNTKWHGNSRRVFELADLYLRRSAHIVDKIITVSEATKKTIIDFYDVPEEKIEIVAPAIFPEITKFRITEEHIKKVKQKFSIRNDYILSICTLEPRKNLISLIRAYEIYREKNKESNIQLVLTGQLGWYYDNILEQINNSKEKKDIVLTDYVSDFELGALYKGASIFAYVSYYEGFGAPILEALYYGKAVLTSNTTSMPEVGGNAACYCNPYDLESIYTSLEQLLENKEYRKGLESMAIQQAGKFSYKRSADKLKRICSELIKGGCINE